MCLFLYVQSLLFLFVEKAELYTNHTEEWEKISLSLHPFQLLALFFLSESIYEHLIDTNLSWPLILFLYWLEKDSKEQSGPALRAMALCHSHIFAGGWKTETVVHITEAQGQKQEDTPYPRLEGFEFSWKWVWRRVPRSNKSVHKEEVVGVFNWRNCRAGRQQFSLCLVNNLNKFLF